MRKNMAMQEVDWEAMTTHELSSMDGVQYYRHQCSIKNVYNPVQTDKRFGGKAMSDIQDEAYTEAMDEIAKLGDKIQYLEGQIAEKDADIEALKAKVAFMASNDYVHSLTYEIERLKAQVAEKSLHLSRIRLMLRLATEI